MIGSGTWATAIVKILLEHPSQRLNWWVRDPQVCDSLRHHGVNCKHLPDLKLDASRINPSTDLDQVVAASDLIFLAIPSAHLEGVLSRLPRQSLEGKRFVSLVKGSLPDRAMSVSQYLEQELGVPHDNICVVSGPSHAEEVSLGMATFLTIATHCPQLASEVEQALRCSYIHTSHTADIDGVECCGLAKNIYAIAAGLCQGLGYGDNMNAVLTTAAFREMRDIMQSRLPYSERDMSRPCYLGDLLVTCWSQHSRNRALGVAVAHGKTVQEAFDNMGAVAEGYYSVRNVHQRNIEFGRKIPVAEAVYRVLYEQADPRTEIDNLIEHVF